jgi:hypothetical protein
MAWRFGMQNGNLSRRLEHTPGFLRCKPRSGAAVFRNAGLQSFAWRNKISKSVDAFQSVWKDEPRFLEAGYRLPLLF